jgi:hypothetical protein
MDNPLTPENENRPSPRPFRLTWTDVLLATTLSLSIAAVWFSLQSLPPIVAAQVHKTSILFYQYVFVNARWLIPAVSFGLAGLLGALTIPYLRHELTKRST